MDIKTTRKCKFSLCEINEGIIVLENDDCVHLPEKKENYHKKCYELYLTKKNKLSQSNDEIISKVEIDWKNSRIWVSEQAYKNQLYFYIMDKYSVTVLPQKLFEKMQGIFEGTFVGMIKGHGISAQEILFIWKSKQGYLDKVNAWNITNGKIIEGVGRINYDLAIVLSKYDEYLKWKVQNKVVEQENKILEESSKINFKNLDKVSCESNNKENNISQILEDLDA
jgi:hypothetical protein